MLPYSHLVESAASVKRTLYLLSDIGDEPLFALPWLPFLFATHPTSPQEPVVPSSSLPAGPLLLEFKALPLAWLLEPKEGSLRAVEADRDAEVWPDAPRIMARLIQLEAHEPDVWLRDDYRQSFITLHLALEGNPQPFVSASYQMYGVHPDKLYPAIVARRKALLGPLYEEITKEEANEHFTQEQLLSTLQSGQADVPVRKVELPEYWHSSDYAASKRPPGFADSEEKRPEVQAQSLAPLAGEQALSPSSPVLPGSPKKSPTSETSDKERAA